MTLYKDGGSNWVTLLDILYWWCTIVLGFIHSVEVEEGRAGEEIRPVTLRMVDDEEAHFFDPYICFVMVQNQCCFYSSLIASLKHCKAKKIWFVASAAHSKLCNVDENIFNVKIYVYHLRNLNESADAERFKAGLQPRISFFIEGSASYFSWWRVFY